MQDLKIELQHSINAYDEKIAKLSARKQALSNDIDRTKQLQLMLLDGEKCKTDEYNFYFITTKSVNISDNISPTDLDEKYQRVSVSFDKTAIKKDLQDGVYVMGAEIVEKKSLVIK